MIPQTQKKHAKCIRYSSGTKSGIAAPAVPNARKNVDSATRKACIPSLNRGKLSPKHKLTVKGNNTFGYFAIFEGLAILNASLA